MQPRRSLRLLAGALVLALPLLTSCGFGKPTDKVYTPGVGTNDRDGDVDVLAAVVVAAQPGSGTFIATLSNGTREEATFESVAGGGDTEISGGTADPAVDIAPRGFVNLAEDGGVPIEGDFGAGDFLTLTLSFGSGDTVTQNVPVVFACDVYEGLDFSADDDETGSEPYDCDAALEEH